MSTMGRNRPPTGRVLSAPNVETVQPSAESTASTADATKNTTAQPQPTRAEQRAAHEAAKAAKKAKHVAPEDAVLPTMGVRSWLYAFNKVIGRADKVPALGKKEQALRDAQLAEAALRTKAEHNTEWLKHVFNTRGATVDGERLQWHALRGVASIHCQKSVGKTTLAVLLASMLARLTNAPILLLPVAANDGSTNLKAGAIDRNTMTIIELEALIAELKQAGGGVVDPAEVYSRLRRNDDGVFVVSQVAPPPGFSGHRLRLLLVELQKIFLFTFLDGGNSVAQYEGAPGGNLEYMAATISDLLVFACLTSVSESPDMMGKTMDALKIVRQDSKLARSLVVVNGFKPAEHNVDDFVMFAENKVERFTDGTVRPYGSREVPIRVAPRTDGERPLAKMMMVPWDQHLVNNPIPKLDELDEATYRAYLDILFEIVQRVAQQRGVDFDLLDKILAADAATYDTSGGAYYAAFDDSGKIEEDDTEPTTERNDHSGHEGHTGWQPQSDTTEESDTGWVNPSRQEIRIVRSANG
jgi:cellulose biosynthesis protein BcsQ